VVFAVCISLSATSQRPTARELLKHKFIRMAKKTNYLTELIERHERWKAEGGERLEDEEQDQLSELHVHL
jgi:serine/threonine-protein kinase 24/25/MST4